MFDVEYTMFTFFAGYFYEAYGMPYIYDEDNEEPKIIGTYCPECGEPIYYEDWSSAETDNWTKCPICEWKVDEEGEND